MVEMLQDKQGDVIEDGRRGGGCNILRGGGQGRFNEKMTFS